MTRTEAVKKCLELFAPADLASLYSGNMECQVNVAQDGGERVDGEYKGRKWQGWSDGLTTWKPFRIPWNAGTDPQYQDAEIKFDLTKHAESIGMTGWDWANKISRWVAFDFDAIVGHSENHQNKLTTDQLAEVQNAVSNIPWVTLRRSTGGHGLHLYVFLGTEIKTANHHEHAALARAVLAKLSALAGYNFTNKVDICGGNMWVWHRKASNNPEALRLIKRGEPLTEEPAEWRNYIDVCNRSAARSKAPSADATFDELCGKIAQIILDDQHKALIAHLQASRAYWWWDQDRQMLVCHTHDLKKAHETLKLRGIFDTISKGEEQGRDINCFCFPAHNGAWIVRRFSKGVNESNNWSTDGAGWTRCYYNKSPDLKTACSAYGGVEEEKGGFVFQDADQALKALGALGVNVDIDQRFLKGRETTISPHKEPAKLVVKIVYNQGDAGMPKWLIVKKKYFQQIVHSPIMADSNVTTDMQNYDNIIRHLVTETGEDYGWVINSDPNSPFWRNEPLTHVYVGLEALGVPPKEARSVVGSAVMKCWHLVNMPFAPEYPGNRQWNRNAVKLRYTPSKNNDNLNYPTWQKILSHCGATLDEDVAKSKWCRENGILRGSDYLKCWMASLFQHPRSPLPYLFFHGPQNSGKSIFHEAIELLIDGGYQRADHALISQNGFNAELESSILCVVEEVDLSKNKQAYNRIKDWVTSRQISIHRKGETPYHVPNSTHWIQCANDAKYCPIFPGDTRITMVFVPPLDPLDLIPKSALIAQLEKEAADFVAELINLDIPPTNDRLNIPVIETSEKRVVAQQNQTSIQSFFTDNVVYLAGGMLKFSDFYDRFVSSLDAGEIESWSKIKVGQNIPLPYIKGRVASENSQTFIGNAAWRNEAWRTGPLVPKNALYLDDGGFLRSRISSEAK